MKRRDFLRTIGISSTATAAACSVDPLHWDPMVPMEKAYPYLIQPEQVLPGVSSFYATQCGQCDAGCGVIARVREGRVVKLEGNDLHPLNKGRLCSNGQSAILDSYSADRFAGPQKGGQALEWAAAVEGLGQAIKSNTGKILWVGRNRTHASEAIVRQFAEVNKMDVLFWEPDGSDAMLAATKQVFGQRYIPGYKLDDAEIILSFGMDFLGVEGNVELANGWANSRSPDNGVVSKTWTVGPRVGMTEASSDKHIRCKIGTESRLALAIAKKLSEALGSNKSPAATSLLGSINADAYITESGAKPELVNALVDDLKKAKKSAVLPGGMATSAQPTELAIASLLINQVAGNLGQTVVLHPQEPSFRVTASAVHDAITSGKYSVVLVDGVDLAYDFSASADFVSKLSSISNLYVFENDPNATTALANATVLPPGTNLERWGDNSPRTGVYTIQQAVMDPMQRPAGQERNTRSAEDVILTVAQALGQKAIPEIVPEPVEQTADAGEATPEGTEASPGAAGESEETSTESVNTIAFAKPDLDSKNFQEYLKAFWFASFLNGSNQSTPDSFWVDCLKRGGYFTEAPSMSTPAWTLRALTPADPMTGNLVIFSHPRIGLARNANRSWLQEVPDALTSFSWGTWVEVSKATSEKLGLTKDKGIEITANGKTFTAGWYLSPGIADDTFAISSAGGQTSRGRYAKVAAENGGSALSFVNYSTDAGGAMQFVGTGASVVKSTALNAPSPRNKLLKSDTLTMNHRYVNFTVFKDDLQKGGEAGSIVPMHHLPDSSMAIVATKTKSRFDENETLKDMFPEPEHPTYRFAMAVDLNRCTGCGACEVACYAENNIPVTGPEEARLSRRMGWIRLSTYWEGDGETPDIRFQPNMCQQCSHAPCEGVCPVLATYHNIDGLNAMIYNRCVGTRYCGNNCPYSARRFNYHTYRWPDSFNLMLNPDVMAREMGVMEKCTFCVQRLRAVKDEHRDQVGFAGQGSAAPAEKLLKLTACAQACPSNAITFGNLNDKESAVAKSFEEPRAYKFLGELNTKPGVAYLSRIVHEKSAQWEHAFGEHHGGGHGNDHGAGHDGDHEHNGSENHGH